MDFNLYLPAAAFLPILSALLIFMRRMILGNRLINLENRRIESEERKHELTLKYEDKKHQRQMESDERKQFLEFEQMAIRSKANNRMTLKLADKGYLPKQDVSKTELRKV